VRSAAKNNKNLGDLGGTWRLGDEEKATVSNYSEEDSQQSWQTTYKPKAT
jgi:hypothetical protein